MFLYNFVNFFYFVIFIVFFECDFMKVCHFCLAREYEGAPIDGARKLSHHLQIWKNMKKVNVFFSHSLLFPFVIILWIQM
jgi:hypothetical protein